MKKYNGLLLGIAEKYHINRGKLESEKDWKARLIYSICAMMAYASLWDYTQEASISIVHLKSRVGETFSSYRELYPEVADCQPYSSEALKEELASLFFNSGIVYHRPNRIVPALRQEKAFGNISFQRGIALDSISCVSGIGFYSLQGGPTEPRAIQMMFGLEREKLLSLWRKIVRLATWQKNEGIERNIEYLRLQSPFYHGYWVNKPDTSGRISILRTGLKGAQLYYLYRYEGKELKVSPLPQWRVESKNYLALANACLSFYESLPPIVYYDDGALIHLQSSYLLPPREQAFLKLYSWPKASQDLPCDFGRCLSIEAFSAIKGIFSATGYSFKEGHANG